MPLKTPLCDRLGIDVPVFGFVHSVQAAAEVTRNGGFGIYGATRDTPEEIRANLKTIRALVGDRPFGVDLVLPPNMPDHDDRPAIEKQLPEKHRAFVDSLIKRYEVPPASKAGMRSRFVRSKDMAVAQIEAVLESDVDLLACGIGAPPDVLRRAKAQGKMTVALVGNRNHASRAIASGVDILVAQGHDAGAHTGPIGTFSLVPQIVEVAGDTPVVAAGGVATGKHIVAALALGAVGVWMGTAWLATKEYGLSETIVEKLLAAGSEDTVISRADSGKTLRQIRSAWSEEWAKEGVPSPLKMPYQDILVGDLLGAIDEHDIKPLVHYPAGQSIAYVNARSTVADVMAQLIKDAREAYGALGKRVTV
ncbi:2-nitropropane dioxygenase [Afipia sp. P52-10]|jgi:NAD(P)H-dependent flavin oxidoreductase YrpB (nitropropane dioxygenase family)|uniref:NAD(P)H-dependent flavin oxidoreductase n=1 Tax=Afipia sp. P52-10 TaxID=1429916 RepID=UPI0003DF07C1|nr:nitronate monooxygenase [Afipia sp. P52-10]ETR78791.1 2-nitropropane dioxygenase [Afipia sp. P52-10]